MVRSLHSIDAMHSEVIDIELLETCARAAHDVVRAYRQGLGDLSQQCWRTAPDWQKQSARARARCVLANPWIAPDDLHEQWMARMLAEGWKLGGAEDADKLEHPDVKPWHELADEARMVNVLFAAVVRQMEEAVRRKTPSELPMSIAQSSVS